MQIVQPLGNEEEILKEAQAAAPPQRVAISAADSQPDPAPSTEPMMAPAQPTEALPDPISFIPGQGVQSPVSSASESLASQQVDLKPFHYALPVQNYIIATVALGAAAAISAVLLYSLIAAANIQQKMTSQFGASSTAGSTISSDIWFVLVPIAIFATLGVSLFKNAKGMRVVSIVAASVGIAWYGYQLIKFIDVGGLKLIGSMLFGSAAFMALLYYIVPVALMGYTLYHLMKARVREAYR